MRLKIWLGLSLLILLGAVGALAYPQCACSCASSCTATCVGPGGLTTCGALGTCSTSSGCGGGGGCLSAKSLEQILGGAAALPVGGQQGRAAARLTWHLTQHVEEGNLGEVYTGGTGFLLFDGLDKVRAPELAFVNREHASQAANAFHVGSPDLVAVFVSNSTPSSAARQEARSWIKAGTQAVLIVDSAQKTVAVYRGAKALEMAGQGGALDLSDVVPGWTLRIDDLFE